MTNSPKLPFEIVTLILHQTDLDTITRSVAQIPQLKQLITLTITDSAKNHGTDTNTNTMTLQDITSMPLDTVFQRYQFYEVLIGGYKEKEYLLIHRILARLIKHQKHINVVYAPAEINMTYLKMFKSLFHEVTDRRYAVSCPNITEVKTNGNHLLISDIVEYPKLTSLNLYYCSSKFYSQCLEFLDLSKHSTFPSLTTLKLQDYMNEEEDSYSLHSNNFVSEDYDYDDFDHNSDLDENEFYFDGLELVQNYTLTRLKSLSMKNCNVSSFKSNYAPMLETLKIFELSNKHIEAFDLNLVDGEHIETHTFLNSSISTSCSVISNRLPSLQTLKLIGHVQLKSFKGNRLKLPDVVMKGCNFDLETKEAFTQQFGYRNEII
jgi:hypothetical protein